MDLRIFPYDYVYFKALNVVFCEYENLWLFPYDYVYFKAHRTGEVLSPPQGHFHTITSILKPLDATATATGGSLFPYDYVYFKAKQCWECFNRK